MTGTATKAIRFPKMLTIPEGPEAGQPVKLAPFQKQFVKVALADGVNGAVVSIGRGNVETGCFTTPPHPRKCGLRWWRKNSAVRLGLVWPCPRGHLKPLMAPRWPIFCELKKRLPSRYFQFASTFRHPLRNTPVCAITTVACSLTKYVPAKPDRRRPCDVCARAAT